MSNLRVFFNNLTKGLNLPNRHDEIFDEAVLPSTNLINDQYHFSSASFLTSVLEGIGDGLVVLDKSHSIITANHGFLEQVNMPADEVIGMPCHKIYHGNEEPCYLSGIDDCTVKRTFETGRNYKSVYRRVNDRGSVLYYETKSFPIKNSAGEIENVVKLFCDITEKANLEEELKKRVFELEEFYDMALGRELRIMELKNELSSLRNRLNILE
jgi:PAS domain S-box-containing protein